jgi:hypothetical protein
MNTNIETMTVKTRDQATSILRKMGMKKENYNQFITKKIVVSTQSDVEGDEFKFIVNVKAAEKFLRPPIQPLTVKDKKKAAKELVAKPTVASVCRALFSTKMNAEIWAIIQPQFNLSDDKKWYPGWYRAADIRRAA